MTRGTRCARSGCECECVPRLSVPMWHIHCRGHKWAEAPAEERGGGGLEMGVNWKKHESMVKGSKGKRPEEVAQRAQIAVFKCVQARRFWESDGALLAAGISHITFTGGRCLFPGSTFLEVLRFILTGYYLFSWGQFLSICLFHEYFHNEVLGCAYTDIQYLYMTPKRCWIF